jgi:flagellar protein FliO/FliZ
MEGSIWIMLLKVIIFLPFTVLLIYLVLKYGGSSALKIQNGKFLKIIEKTSLSKDSSIVIASIGKKYYLISSTSSRNEILMELDQDEINEYLANKNNSIKNGLNNMFNRGRQ